jgi:hypothetical protein
MSHYYRGATRRELIAGALCACALPMLPTAGTSRTLISRVRDLLAPDARARREDVVAARLIVFGTESAPDDSLHRWSDAQIAARIRRNITDDFQNGRWVNAEGWQLAATEWQAVQLIRRSQLA